MVAQKTKSTRVYIAETLRDIGIPASLLGYEYLKTAIILVLREKDYLNAITKQLYPDIAAMHATTASRAERAIRHAIEVCFDRCEFDLITEIFGACVKVHSGKPTNSEFIAGVAEYVRIQRGDYDDV